MTVRIHSHGYILRDGVYEHRAVMEGILGRKLGRREHVHHKNGDRTDNRPENLEVLGANEHQQHHGRANETWTPEQDAFLAARKAEGYSTAWVARELGFSVSRVNNRMTRLKHRGARFPSRAGRKGESAREVVRCHPKTHCKRGHAFTPENTYMQTPTHRACRVCSRASKRRYKMRQRERYEAEG